MYEVLLLFIVDCFMVSWEHNASEPTDHRQCSCIRHHIFSPCPILERQVNCSRQSCATVICFDRGFAEIQPGNQTILGVGRSWCISRLIWHCDESSRTHSAFRKCFLPVLCPSLSCYPILSLLFMPC